MTSFDLPVKFFSCIHATYAVGSFVKKFTTVSGQSLLGTLSKKLYEVGGSRSISGQPPPPSKCIPKQDPPSLPLIAYILLVPSWCKGRLRWLKAKIWGLRCNRCTKNQAYMPPLWGFYWVVASFADVSSQSRFSPFCLHRTATASPDAANAHILLTIAVTTRIKSVFPLKLQRQHWLKRILLCLGYVCLTKRDSLSLKRSR